MTLTSLGLKLISAVVVIVATVIGIVIPFKMRSTIDGVVQSSFLFFSNQFVSGVFLGAAVLHLLPDSLESLSRSGFDVDTFNLPICLVAAGFGFFFADFWRNVSSLKGSTSEPPEEVPQDNKDEEALLVPKICVYSGNSHGKKIGPLVSVLLSIHSFTTGIALGATDKSSDTMALLIAIIAHKSVEAFALCLILLKERASKSNLVSTLVLYSSATPLGILICALVYAAFTGPTMLFIQSLVTCFASGNLIYVAVTHMLEHTHDGRFLQSLLPGVLFQLVGFCIMLVVAIWN